jgi:hypothetical protein
MMGKRRGKGAIMSIHLAPTLICDGCGTIIEKQNYVKIRPTAGQKVIQKDKRHSYDRDFCCEACMSWWRVQFPANGPWGPAWDERDWWREQTRHARI